MAYGSVNFATGDPGTGSGGASSAEITEALNNAKEALSTAKAAQTTAQDVSTKVAAFDTRITNAETSAKTAVSSVNDMADTVGAMTGRIDAATKTANDAKAAVDSVSASIETVNTAAADAKKAADAATKTVEGIDAKLEKASTDAASAKETADGLATQVTTATNAADAATEAANKAAADLAEAQAGINEANENADAAKAEAAAAKKAADDALAKINAAGTGLKVDTKVPSTLKAGEMVLVGSKLYVGASDGTVLMFVSGTSTTEEITIKDGEVAFIENMVYFGDSDAQKVSFLFTGKSDVITEVSDAPTTAKQGSVVAYNHKIYVGDVNDVPVEIKGAKTPKVRPQTADAGFLYIWGEIIYFRLSSNKWLKVGEAKGVGTTVTGDPGLDSVYRGDIYVYAGHNWLVGNATAEWIYLLLLNPTDKTTFGESAAYAGSTLEAKATAFLATLPADSLANIGGITVGEASTKVNSIPNERLVAYPYLQDGANRIAKMADGTAVGWWTASSVTEGKVRVVDATGAYIDAEPSAEYYFRPFIAVKPA